MKKNPVLFIFLIIATIENFSTEVILPAFPAIQKALHVDKSQVALTLTLFLFGFAASPLIVGPIADKIGRRRLLILMMIMFAVAAFFQMTASTILMIQLCRLMQGLASGGFFVINQAMIRESYSKQKLPHITALVAIAWAVMSLLSPLCGGYMQNWYTWRESFFLILIYVSVICCFIYLVLPETLDRDNRSYHLSLRLSDIEYLLKREGFIISAILASLTYAIVFIFYSVSPFLFEDFLGLSPVLYAWILFAAGFAYLIGALINRFICQYLYTTSRLKIGLVGVVLCVCFFCANLLRHKEGIFELSIPFILMMTFAGCVFPNTLAIAMGVQEKRYATASAMYCSIQFFGSAMATFIVSRVFKDQLYPIAIIMLIIVSFFPLILKQFQMIRVYEW